MLGDVLEDVLLVQAERASLLGLPPLHVGLSHQEGAQEGQGARVEVPGANEGDQERLGFGGLGKFSRYEKTREVEIVCALKQRIQ